MKFYIGLRDNKLESNFIFSHPEFKKKFNDNLQWLEAENTLIYLFLFLILKAHPKTWLIAASADLIKAARLLI